MYGTKYSEHGVFKGRNHILAFHSGSCGVYLWGEGASQSNQFEASSLTETKLSG